ncbi:MAG: hypothetical protein ACREOD_01730 [Candidatus Dormibacteria bacterium]
MSGRPSPPPRRPNPGTFQGWQRGACLTGFALLLLLALLVVVNAALGIVGVH